MSRSYPTHPRIGIAAVVWRADRVLLVQRRHPPRAGEWSLPGGGLELGETLAEGAAREVYEETGCTIRVGELVAAVDSITYDTAGKIEFHYVLIDLVAEWVAGEAQPNDESSAIAWATLDQLPAYELWSETERIIRLAATKRGI